MTQIYIGLDTKQPKTYIEFPNIIIIKHLKHY